LRNNLLFLLGLIINQISSPILGLFLKKKGKQQKLVRKKMNMFFKKYFAFSKKFFNLTAIFSQKSF
jgi:hypothetical protein